MSSNDHCPICLADEATSEYERKNDSHYYECPRCGSFSADREFKQAYASAPADTEWRWKLSSSVRAATDRAKKLSEVITCENFSNIIERTAKPANALENADYLITAIADRTKFLGSKTPEEKPNALLPWVARAWLPSANELFCLNSELEKVGLFTHESVLGYSYQLNTAGWQRALELKRSRGPGNQAFVAMWFDKKLDEVFTRGIAPALNETGYAPCRVDQVHVAEKIDNRIVAELRRSQLVIADCTGARPSVYFEAGFAMGLGIDVIWCCHTTDLSAVAERPYFMVPPPNTGNSTAWSDLLAFDTRQYPHLLWSEPEQLRDALIACICARGLSLEEKRHS